ncbi:MAG: efflux RND transporter permease subunit, partial [Bdellovibrionia bacterium]
MSLNTIIQWSVHRRWMILFLTSLGCIWGGISFLSLPIDAVPDITPVQVQINATSQGLSPEDLESKVTYPMEIAVRGIPGVEQIRSLTKFGLSQVTILFDDSTDVYRARQLVSEKLQNLRELPPGVTSPTLSPITTGLGEIFHYTIEIKNQEPTENTLMQIREIQDWIIKPRLLSIPGVAEVNTIGGYSRQLQVQPQLKKLAAYRLSLNDLKEALIQANRNTGGSHISEHGKSILVQATGQFQSIQAIEQLPIKSLQNLKPVLIQDVAQVRFAGATRVGAALVQGREAVLGTVMMLSGANSRTVAKAVGERIQELNSSQELPEGVRITSLYDRSKLVDATLNTVIHNLVVGATLVILVLFVLLGNLKAAFIVSLSIPVTLLLTLGAMKSLGISGNLMSLGALDFGIIVDGAVIVVDHCVRWIQDRKKTQGILEKVTGASQEIRSAAGFGQLMIILVFLPILGLSGVEGKMFRPMAETFSIALGVALILSFTFIPALAGLLFSDSERDQTPKLMHWIESQYERILKHALRAPQLILGSSLALLLLALFGFKHLGAEFIPHLDEGSLVLQLIRPVDISLSASVDLQALSEKRILEFGAFQSVFSRIGTPEIATDPMGVHESDTFIELKPSSQWVHAGRRFESKGELVEALLEDLKQAIPEQEASTSQPIQMRFNELMTGAKQDV